MLLYLKFYKECFCLPNHWIVTVFTSVKSACSECSRDCKAMKHLLQSLVKHDAYLCMHFKTRRNPKDLTTCCSPSNLVISDYHLFTCSNLPPGTVQWTSPDPFQQLLCCLNIISHLQCYFYRPTVSSNIKLSWYTFRNRCCISRIMNLPDSIGRELRCWGFLYEAGIYLNISFEKRTLHIHLMIPEVSGRRWNLITSWESPS